MGHWANVAIFSDVEAMLAIYAPYVERTAVTFEYDVPTACVSMSALAIRRSPISIYAERNSAAKQLNS